MSSAGLLTPKRQRGVEYLDDPATPDSVRTRALADVARSNALFGGRAAVLRAVRGVESRLPKAVTLLDVGSGHGEIAAALGVALRASGRSVTVVGLDLSPAIAAGGRARLDATLSGSALQLPLRARSVDLVICSQLLHHFVERDARAVIAEMNRVSRGWVVIADLMRSRVAAAGFWLASIALGFHPVTRHDGVVSVLRGFTVAELDAWVRETTGVAPTTHTGMFWRLSATWKAA